MAQKSKDVQFIDIPLQTEITCLVNKSGKVSTRLVGFHGGEFFILQFPRLPSVARYLREGVSFGAHFSQGSSNIFFSSTIEGVVEKKFLAVCKYPEVFKVFEVRGGPRMACLIPVSVAHHGTCYGGVMTNLSESGCHIVLDVTGGSEVRGLEPGETLTLECSAQGGTFLVDGEVMHASRGLSRTALGIAFRKVDNGDTSALTNLIQSLHASQGRRP